MFTTALPKVIADYGTLFLPFDVWTWTGFVISVVLELAMLLGLDWLWRTLPQGWNATKSYLYQGRNANPYRNRLLV